MSKTSIDLKQGIKVHYIKTDLFKTDFSCVILTTPLTRENVTPNALIPFLLKRGTAKLPNQYLISEKLEDMYGASFNCGIDKIGDNVILKFCMESINNQYALDSENILKMNIESLLDIVFNPIKKEGLLNEEFLNVEKENLKNVIESKIDDKDSYAFDSCISSMYKDEGFGLYKFGYVEDIDSINIKQISEYYDWLINNAKIDIFISGDFKESEISNILEENENIKKLNPRTENYVHDSTECRKSVEKTNQIEEKMDVTQGKLVMGLELTDVIENLQEVGMVYNAILGNGANSMIFQNVREKASLAYSARSTFNKSKKAIFIRCGIQIENFQKAVDLLKVQLENIKSGNFTEEDIENAKIYLISGLRNIEEEQDTEIVYYISQELSKRDISVEQYMENIQKVSKDDIIKFANLLSINTIYFLRN